MQIQITIRYYYSTNLASKKHLDKDIVKQGLSCFAGGNINLFNFFGNYLEISTII